MLTSEFNDLALGVLPKCLYCGLNGGHGIVCPQIKSVSYDEEGRVRRVDLLTPNDVPQTLAQQRPDKISKGRPITGYGKCSCIFPEYCDGNCRPIFGDAP